MFMDDGKKEEEIDWLARSFSIAGTILAVGLNLSPIVLFYQFFRKQKEFKDIPEMMFLVGVFCSLTNLGYGILVNDPGLYINSIICTIIQIIYATLYLYFYAEKNFSKFLLYLFISYDLSAEVLYLFADVFEHHMGYNNAENFTGIFNIVITVLNAGAPGQKIIEVWKTKNHTLIPIVTTIFQILCSANWALYGIFRGLEKIIIPNVLGVVLCAVQIFSYYFWYFKNGGKKPETSEEEGETKEESNNENDPEKIEVNKETHLLDENDKSKDEINKTNDESDKQKNEIENPNEEN